MNLVSKIIIVVLVLIITIAIVWSSLRYWEYQKQASLRAGISAFKVGEYKDAMKKIKPFAQSGNPLAQELLGKMFTFGLGIPKDTIQARIWYRRAECNNLMTGVSEYYVALDYLDEGHLASVDHSEALNWLEYAANAGNVDAQQLLSDPEKLKDQGLVVQLEVINYWKNFIELEN